jgi:hypothetical protein
VSELIPALVVWGLILGGGASVAIGLCFIIGTLRFLGRAVPLPGRVAGYEVHEGVDSEGVRCVYYHPTLEFEDEAGRSHRVTLSFGSSARSHEVGAPVTVLFDPSDPSRSRLRSFLHLWLFPLASAALGAVGLAGGLGFGFLCDVL